MDQTEPTKKPKECFDDIKAFQKMRPNSKRGAIAQQYLAFLLELVQEGKTSYTADQLKALGFGKAERAVISRMFVSEKSANLVRHKPLDQSKLTNQRKARGDARHLQEYELVMLAGKFKSKVAKPEQFKFYAYYCIFVAKNQQPQTAAPTQ